MLEFRHYEPADRNDCIRIFESRVGPFFSPHEADDIAEHLDDLEEPPDVEEVIRFFVGVHQGRVMAMGGFEVLGEAAYLTWGTVHAEYGGLGFGRALLEHRLNLLRTWEPAVGSVFCDTTPAVAAFYAKFGFQPFFTAPTYWGGELDLVAMELSWDGQERGPKRVRPDGTLGYRVLSDA